MKNYIPMFILSLAVIFCSPLKAQITIGSGTEPNPGALLDLKEENKKGENARGGLLLPRVKLQDRAILQPNGGSFAGNDIHTGLTVYNLRIDLDKDLCEGPYVWDGAKWNRLLGNCIECEHRIKGKDGKYYFVYCIDFADTPMNAIARCKDATVTNNDGSVGQHAYHLMTFEEFEQIWDQPVEYTGNYLFRQGKNYYMHYSHPSYLTHNGWITAGKIYNDGTHDWGEVIGVGRSRKGAPAIPTTNFFGGLSVNSSLEYVNIVRCIRD